MCQGEGLARIAYVRSICDVVWVWDKNAAGFIGFPSDSLRLGELRDIHGGGLCHNILQQAVQ